MKKTILFLLCALIFSGVAKAETVKPTTDANVFGHILDAKTREHLPFISVQVKGTTLGTTTDATGHYFLKNLPAGKNITLEIKALGYKTITKDITVVKDKSLEVNFEMEEEAISLDAVVVSANRNETTRRLAPSLVSILDVKTFERTNSCDLSQGLKFQPGLRVETNCQNCGFSQVRINGLEGPYSQVLIDSRAVMGSLAGVYGLEQIPAGMIDRVEVMRGGGSALFGSSAIGGVINIITKEPVRNSGEISNVINTYSGHATQNSTSFNASMLTDSRKAGVMVFGQNRIRDGFDYDKDGFTELPVLKNRTLGFQSFLKTGLYSKLTLEYRNMHEFRRGGDRLNRPPHEAYIAEQLEHFINGGGINYKQWDPSGNNTFSLYTSVQHTLRNSYYGGGDSVTDSIPAISATSTPEEIEKINAMIKNNNSRLNSYGRTTELVYQLGGQYMHAFHHLLFMPAEMTGGLEYIGNQLNDASGYRLTAIDQTTKNGSAFFQNEWKNNQWGFLIGGRLDKHNLVKHLIFSPRANVRYNPTKDVNIRVSYSEGFRVPQYFDEDLHVDIAGGDQLVRRLADDLSEERSRSVSSSVDFYHSFGLAQLNILLEGFYTHLNKPFEAVKKGTDVLVQNSADGAKVYGVNLEGRVALGSHFQLQSGATIQRSLYDSERKWLEIEDPNDPEEVAKDKVESTRRMMRTPNVYAYFVATWTPVKPFSTVLSGNYTGSMLVPHDAGEGEAGKDKFSPVNITEKTPKFFEVNLKLAYDFTLYDEVKMQFNAGIQNMFNAYQKDFDTGAGRASAYIYGPTAPRNFFAGVKLSF